MTETTSTAKPSHMHAAKGKPGMSGKESAKHSTQGQGQNPSSIAASLVKGPSLSVSTSPATTVAFRPPEEASLVQFAHRKSPLTGDVKGITAGPIAIGKMSYSKAAQSKSIGPLPAAAKPAPPIFPDDKKSTHPVANGQTSSARPMTFGNVQLPPRTQSAPPNIEELNQLLASATISSLPTSHSSQLSCSVVNGAGVSPVQHKETLMPALSEPTRKLSIPPPAATHLGLLPATPSRQEAPPTATAAAPPPPPTATVVKQTPAIASATMSPAVTTLHANAPLFRPKAGPPPATFAYYPPPAAAYGARPPYYAPPDSGYYRPPPQFPPYGYPGGQPPFVPGYNAPFMPPTATSAAAATMPPPMGTSAATPPGPRVSKAIKITDPKTGEAVNLTSAAVPSLNKPPTKAFEDKKDVAFEDKKEIALEDKKNVAFEDKMESVSERQLEQDKTPAKDEATARDNGEAASPQTKAPAATISVGEATCAEKIQESIVETLTSLKLDNTVSAKEDAIATVPSIALPSEGICEIDEESLTEYSESEEIESTLAGSTLDFEYPENLVYPKTLLLCFEPFPYVSPESWIPSSISELLGEGSGERPGSGKSAAPSAPPGYGSGGRSLTADSRGLYHGPGSGYDAGSRNKRPSATAMMESRSASQSQSSLQSASSRSSRSSKYYDERDTRRSGRDLRGPRSGPLRGGQSGSQSSSEAAALAAILLPQSEHRWIRPDTTKSTDSERLIRTIKGNLNKLTAENFDRVTTRIIQSTVPHLQVLIDAYSRLEENYKLHLKGESVPEETVSDAEMEASAILASMIQIIFDKAVDEPNFSPLYAMTCHRIVASSAFPSLPGMVDQKLSKVSLFKQLLLKKCQEEYEKKVAWTKERMSKLRCAEEAKESNEQKEDAAQTTAPSPSQPLGSEPDVAAVSLTADQQAAEEEYQRLKLKRRTLGNIAFIGHLYRQGLLNERIIHKCIQDLLEDITNIEEEELECCCKLISTVGSNLDQPKAKPHVDKYFERLLILIGNNKLSSRLRFMIMDLVDLRAAGWDRKRASHIGKETMSKDEPCAPPGFGRSHASGPHAAGRDGSTLGPPPGLRSGAAHSERERDRDRRSATGPSPSLSVASGRSSQYSGNSKSCGPSSGAASSYQILSRKNAGREEDFTVVRGSGRRAPTATSAMERRASEIPGSVSAASMTSSIASAASSSGLASADNMFSHLQEVSSNSETESPMLSDTSAAKKGPHQRIPEYVKMMCSESLPHEELQDMAQESKGWRSALGGTESLFYEYLRLCIDKNAKELERCNAFLLVLFDVLSSSNGSTGGIGLSSLVGSFRRVVETYDDWKADVPKIDQALGALFGSLLARVTESAASESKLAAFFAPNASDACKAWPLWLTPIAATPKSALSVLKETLFYVLNRGSDLVPRLRSAIVASALDLEGALSEEEGELYTRFLASHAQFPGLFPRSTRRAIERIVKDLPKPAWTVLSAANTAKRQDIFAELLGYLQTEPCMLALKNEPNATEGLLAKLLSDMASGATELSVPPPSHAGSSFAEWLEDTAMSQLLGQEWGPSLALVARQNRHFPISVLNGLSLAFKSLSGPNRKDWLKVSFKSLHSHAPIAFPRAVYLAYADDTSVDKGEAFFPLSAWLAELRAAEEEAMAQEEQEDKSSEEEPL